MAISVPIRANKYCIILHKHHYTTLSYHNIHNTYINLLFMFKNTHTIRFFPRNLKTYSFQNTRPNKYSYHILEIFFILYASYV